MNRNIKILLGVLVVLVLVGGAYYLGMEKGSDAKPKDIVTASPTPEHYPVPPPAETAGTTNAASPEDSAQASVSLSAALVEMLGKENFEKFVEPGDLIRNFVVTIDNLLGSKLPPQYLPVRRDDGEFTVRDLGESSQGPGILTISSKNYDRYTPYVNVLSSLDVEALGRLYSRFYPMLQKAYAELGHNEYLNDRLVQILDKLCDTPRITGEVRLVHPSVLYQFEDPKLESLPVGSKILLRMGPENAEKTKNFLKALREKLTHLNS